MTTPQGVRFSLDDLERLIPAMPQQVHTPGRTYTGRFDPHHGQHLLGEAQKRLLAFLEVLGLQPHPGDRYRGACPFPHVGGPCDCNSAFYISLISGAWHCFCSDHMGKTSGSVASLISL